MTTDATASACRHPVAAIDAGHEHGARAHQVAEHLEIRRPDVQAGDAAVTEESQRRGIRDECDRRDDDDDRAADLGRLGEPPQGFDEHHDTDAEQDDGVDGGRQDLEAVQAERAPGGARAGSDRDCTE